MWISFDFQLQFFQIHFRNCKTLRWSSAFSAPTWSIGEDEISPKSSPVTRRPTLWTKTEKPSKWFWTNTGYSRRKLIASTRHQRRILDSKCSSDGNEHGSKSRVKIIINPNFVLFKLRIVKSTVSVFAELFENRAIFVMSLVMDLYLQFRSSRRRLLAAKYATPRPNLLFSITSVLFPPIFCTSTCSLWSTSTWVNFTCWHYILRWLCF